MPGNPKECRKHALNCQRLAKTATNEHDRQQLRALADSWLALAAELESMGSLLDTFRVPATAAARNGVNVILSVPEVPRGRLRNPASAAAPSTPETIGPTAETARSARGCGLSLSISV